MLKKGIILLLFLYAVPLFSQQTVEDILTQEPVVVSKFSLKKIEENQVLLRTEFADYKILNKEDIDLFNGKVITGVSVIYTRFAASEVFSQIDLNRKRLNELKILAPALFSNDVISWNLLEQIDCNSAEQGKRMLHGFVITYRPESSPELAQKEIEFLTKTFYVPEFKGKDSLNQQRKNPEIIENAQELIQHIVDKAPCCYTDSVTRIVSFRLDKKGKTSDVKILDKNTYPCDAELIATVQKTPAWNLGIRQSYEADKYFEIPFSFNCKAANPITVNGFYANDPADRIVFKSATKTKKIIEENLNPDIKLEDTSLLQILKKHSSFKNITIVCDLTGSMAKYTAQFLLWLKESGNTEDVHRIIFFNDGDNKPDKKKVIGAVGGIYHVPQGSSFSDVFDWAVSTMEKGHGGDVPENNIEAILEAQRTHQADSVLMICDNFAIPRDMYLIPEVKIPIHLIVCGTEGGINTAYLDMVRATKGTLYTVEKDFKHLYTIKDDEEFAIEKHRYKFNGVRFMRVK